MVHCIYYFFVYNRKERKMNKDQMKALEKKKKKAILAVWPQEKLPFAINSITFIVWLNRMYTTYVRIFS